MKTASIIIKVTIVFMILTIVTVSATPATGTLTVWTIMDGMPKSGVSVWLDNFWSRSGSTNYGGYTVFPNVPIGAHTVYAMHNPGSGQLIWKGVSKPNIYGPGQNQICRVTLVRGGSFF